MLSSQFGSYEVVTHVELTGEDLKLHQIVSIARHGAKISLGAKAQQAVHAARKCIEERLITKATYYGINTGFGSLAQVKISPEKLSELQFNLIRSHACGVGELLEPDVVRAVMALRIQTMLRGNSGVRLQLIELMMEFLNRDITPCVPSKGSVGACGDLAPLAHLALAFIGEGEVFYKGKKQPSLVAMQQEKIEPLSPEAKEGLALINGTQVMTALGILCAHDSYVLLRTADVAAAMTLDAVRGTKVAFRQEIQKVRPQRGQDVVAKNVCALLEDDAIATSHKDCGKVQDPYSIRCVPQVHGAARNAFLHVLDTLIIEANSSTDNPLVFPETDEILSGGNFHGEPVAMVLDYLAIAMSEIASISERRIDKLVNPHMSGLPPFLARDSGLNSGYMIPHVVAAALVSENKMLSHPASVDSLPTSAEQEDHVSMGMTAALKLHTVVKNVRYVLAIETITAADGLEFHLPNRGGIGVEAARQFIRTFCPPMLVDRSLAKDFEQMSQKIASGAFIQHVEKSLPAPLL